MQNLASYRSNPADLRQIIASLHAVLTSAKPKVRPQCDRVRVPSHLAGADYGRYRRLLSHDDPKVKAIAWAFLNGSGRQTSAA